MAAIASNVDDGVAIDLEVGFVAGSTASVATVTVGVVDASRVGGGVFAARARAKTLANGFDFGVAPRDASLIAASKACASKSSDAAA